MATRFTPSLELAGAFHAEVVRPLLDEAFPGSSGSTLGGRWP
jgi:hypothetical protein